VSAEEPATDGGIEEILAAGAIRSVFQPIVDLDSGRVVAYEAFAKLQIADRAAAIIRAREAGLGR